MSDFSNAFDAARAAGKGIFLFNNKTYNTRYKNESEEEFRNKFKDYDEYLNSMKSTRTNTNAKSTPTAVDVNYGVRIVPNDAVIPENRLMKSFSSEIVNRRPQVKKRSLFGFENGGQINKHQLGGLLSMNEQELLQAFIQFLAQKTGAKTLQELESVILLLGEEGLKLAYSEFIQIMLLQQVLAAKFGAKLNYIRHLRGNCPEGYEMQYFKSGGQLCKKCVAKLKAMLDGGELTDNPIDQFKCGRKMKKKKAEGGNIEFDKCGKKMKKKECGGTMNKKWTPKNK